MMQPQRHLICQHMLFCKQLQSSLAGAPSNQDIQSTLMLAHYPAMSAAGNGVSCRPSLAPSIILPPQPAPAMVAQRLPAARRYIGVAAQKPEVATVEKDQKKPAADFAGLGELGPIGLTVGGDIKTSRRRAADSPQPTGVELGPIGLTFNTQVSSSEGLDAEQQQPKLESIHSMTTAEWRAKYEKDGTVDLWVEEEFNAGSRLVGGRAVHKGGVYGFRTGEGPSAGDVATHRVKITNHYADQVVEVDVPEDRYIMWEAEDNGLQLPYACRMGCCTACAVRIKEGEMYQPEALGISEELKQQGYGLMCVGFPMSDLVLETVPEDEIYDLQFGQYFAQQALDPSNPETIERDDYALSIANMDE